MRSGKYLIFIAVLFYSGTGLFSQKTDNPYYFPVRPGEKNYLSGTMGEIRSTHFHTGIDIKTSGISGLKVFATRPGYISRIRIGPEGYGNCLYVAHPGGEISVYGHLSEFREDIRDYTLAEQYNRQTFEINLFPKPGRFPVKKGEFIAYSGNSGSSSGPHLHFEIRDSLQNVLNPLEKEFEDIKDDIPPIVQAFSIKTLDIHARVNGQFGNIIFTPGRLNTEFYYNNPIDVYGLIGLQLQAHDKLSGAANKNGIPFIRMYLDDQVIYDASIKKFTFGNSAHTPVYYDNQIKSRTGRTFLKLYIDDGNSLPFYDLSPGKGKILINDTLEHSIEVVLGDRAGNKSVLGIKLKGTIPDIYAEEPSRLQPENLSWDISENTLIIKHKIISDSLEKAIVHLDRRNFEMIPSYSISGTSVYLWDLRQGIPELVSAGSDSVKVNICISVPPGTAFTYYDPFFEFKTTKNSLFDTLYLTRNYTPPKDLSNEIFQIGSREDALAGKINISFNSRLYYENREKYGVYYIERPGKFAFAGNDWKDGMISITTVSLGNFTILKDSIPPAITPIRLNREIVSFRIRDELSGIKSFNASLNDKWLLMYYDAKRDHIWSVKLNKDLPLQGEFYLSVTDNCGNISEYKAKID